MEMVIGKLNDAPHNPMHSTPQCKEARKSSAMLKSFQGSQVVAYLFCVTMGFGIISKTLNLTFTSFGFVPMI